MTTPDPRNIRRVVEQIRSALDGYRREELVEILAYVFKTYVVEGGSALSSGAAQLLDARSELDGLNFAQLVVWLQQHLDAPELGLFEVQGERVSVRAGGRAVPIEAPRSEPVAPPPAAAPPSPSPPKVVPATASPVAAPAAAETAKTEEPAVGPDSRFKRLEVD